MTGFKFAAPSPALIGLSFQAPSMSEDARGGADAAQEELARMNGSFTIQGLDVHRGYQHEVSPRYQYSTSTRISARSITSIPVLGVQYGYQHVVLASIPVLNAQCGYLHAVSSSILVLSVVHPISAYSIILNTSPRRPTWIPACGIILDTVPRCPNYQQTEQ